MSRRAGGWKIAVLYAVNTAGAAAGAFLTDFALVPSFGLTRHATRRGPPERDRRRRRARCWRGLRHPRGRRPGWRAASVKQPTCRQALRPVAWASLALMLSGFAAMGLEIVWLRHFTLLLGGFRAVFSLVLTIVLVGIGAGSLLGGYIDRRTARPAQALDGGAGAAGGLGAGWPRMDERRGARRPSTCDRPDAGEPDAVRALDHRALVQRAADAGRARRSRASDGLLVSPGKCGDSAHGARGRQPRRRAVPRQHGGRRLRFARDRICAAAGSRHAGQRDGAHAGRRAGDRRRSTWERVRAEASRPRPPWQLRFRC